MLRLEHGIGNDFDMDTAEFTEFRAQFLADFAQIPADLSALTAAAAPARPASPRSLSRSSPPPATACTCCTWTTSTPAGTASSTAWRRGTALSVQLTEGIAGTYTPWDWEAGAPR